MKRRSGREDALELRAIAAALERHAPRPAESAAPSTSGAKTPRWNARPEEVQRAVLKLVLTLVELLRQLMERQALRRMDAGTLTEDQIEGVGLALMRLEETVHDLAARFDIDPSELNLDLGPLGRLL